MRIGVIADTHIPGRARSIPEAALRALSGTDLILHAGDLVCAEVLTTLLGLAPVHAVAGNNDPPSLTAGLGLTCELMINGYRIGMTHGHIGKGKRTVERALSHFPEADCVVFGHSHMPYCAWHGRILAFNPGSPTDPRRAPGPSVGILHLEPGGLRGEHQW